jgi:hypothetical protein
VVDAAGDVAYSPVLRISVGPTSSSPVCTFHNSTTSVNCTLQLNNSITVGLWNITLDGTSSNGTTLALYYNKTLDKKAIFDTNDISQTFDENGNNIYVYVSSYGYGPAPSDENAKINAQYSTYPSTICEPINPLNTTPQDIGCIIYVGHNYTAGPVSVQLQNITQYENTYNQAALAIYYKGKITNETLMQTGSSLTFNVLDSNTVTLYTDLVNFGPSVYQKWVMINVLTKSAT